MQTNVTMDIYHAGNAPPAAPDIAGAKGFLRAAFPEGYKDQQSGNFSHVLDVTLDTDLRGNSAVFLGGANADTVFIPDKDGTAFSVIEVIRISYTGSADIRRAFIKRNTTAWATAEYF